MCNFCCTFAAEMRINRVILCVLLAFLGAAVQVSAETKEQREKWRHEVRVGWGDQLFETLMWRPATVTTTMFGTWQKVYHEDYHYDQHLWAEYQYRFNHWLSLGGLLDLSEVHWDDVTRDGTGAEISRLPGQYFYNAVLMPTVRFTYFHHPYVNLYSGLGVGLDINGGTEVDANGKHDVVGAAINVTFIGVSANYDRWFWTFDLGGMYALKNANVIFMAGSRIMSVSFGARF